MNTPKLVNRKETKEIHYPLDKIYYAEVNDYECIVCETYLNHQPLYIQLMTLPDYNINSGNLQNFKIKKSLKEEINSKKMNVCLLTKDGKEKRELTVSEIINILKIMSLLENKSYDSLNDLCIKTSNKISDLLGININSNSSSNLILKDIEEIAVPATKVLKFKNLLFNYIKISIILDNEITITNNDYRILRALKGAKIKTPEFENEFVITIKVNGEETIDCQNIEGIKQTPKSYQKTNKYKKA